MTEEQIPSATPKLDAIGEYFRAIQQRDIENEFLRKQNEELQEKLTEAKEIIRELLSSCFGYNSKTINYEVKAKAEAFLKE